MRTVKFLTKLPDGSIGYSIHSSYIEAPLWQWLIVVAVLIAIPWLAITLLGVELAAKAFVVLVLMLITLAPMLWVTFTWIKESKKTL
jgi:hypothetical protein